MTCLASTSRPSAGPCPRRLLPHQMTSTHGAWSTSTSTRPSHSRSTQVSSGKQKMLYAIRVSFASDSPFGVVVMPATHDETHYPKRWHAYATERLGGLTYDITESALLPKGEAEA